ncbi:MAG: hypothetical protein QXV17_07770 [Candidatus Micrarchaeaceae archaeon]
MPKINISKTSFYALFIVLNLIIQILSYAIFRLVHSEGYAIAFEVFVSMVGNGLLTLVNSEQSVMIKQMIKGVILNKAVYAFFITLANAIAQLIQSIISVRVSNQIISIVVSFVISIIGTFIVMYLTVLENQAPASVSKGAQQGQ